MSTHVLPRLPLWPLLVLLLSGLIAWNALPFRDRSMHIRMKDLSFLPDPVLGRMLCLGQCGALSKLSWIDSFAYFELQLDRRNDTLAGSHASGFQRLYGLLIAEDPLYQPFYEYAAFNTGALLRQHNVALGFLMRGLLEMPHNPQLWREAAAELYASYELEDHHPEQMDAFLTQWADAMQDDIQRRQVWDWKAAMGRRHHLGLGQLSYWQEQLTYVAPDSSQYRYICGAMREELARYGVDELQALADEHKRRALMPIMTIDDVVDPALLLWRYPHGLPGWGPIAVRQGSACVREDPFGFPYLFHDGAVISPGLERLRMEKHVPLLNDQLEQARQGRHVANLEEASHLIVMPWMPPSGHLRLDHDSLALAWDDPPAPPWSFGNDRH